MKKISQRQTIGPFRYAEPLIQGCRSLLHILKNHQLILMGEATHGTREFYEIRVHLTKRLILDQDVAAIAIEGDWPSVFRVNDYVQWRGTDRSADEALAGFIRFPLWMWRNSVMLEFVEWLRRYNRNRALEQQVGIYGLDMYSLYESAAAVTEYLDRVDPVAARQAREYYACLDQVEGPERGSGLDESCQEKVLAQLHRLRDRAFVYAKEGDRFAAEEQFQAEQNARLIVAAEAYYRHMFDSRKNTWNMRDSHMFDTLTNLQAYISEKIGRQARIVVWEHNSHLGDARATSMGFSGQHNVGQLVRQHCRSQAYLLGFTTYSGAVTAASRWDGPVECKRILEAMDGSVEKLFHQVGIRDFFLPFDQDNRQPESVLLEPMLQRAIGVLYLPKTERHSHYLTCRIGEQFDGVIHIDESSALEPLDAVSEWRAGEEMTYPFGV